MSLCKLFNEAIVVNSIAFEDTDTDISKLEFFGNKVETALLYFVKHLGWVDYHKTCKQPTFIQIFSQN